MFNWLKRSALTTKISPEQEVAITQDADSFTPSAMRESVAFKDQGNAYLENGKLDDAAKCYKRAIELNPQYAEAYTNLGFVFQANGNLNEAEEHYRKAITLNPNLLTAHQNLSIVLMGLG